MANKYSNLKIFHYQNKLDSLPKNITDIKAPIHIRIKPTNVCNHDCWYCAYKADNLQLGQDMVERDYIPHDKMMQIIDDCKEMGIKAITFSGGGEPFTYRYFTDTIKKVIESNISFASLTNGSRLKDEIAELFAYNATWVRVSIDGYDDESYAEYRGVKIGEFSKIVDNMKKFASLPNRTCNLGVSFIVDNKNYSKIYEFSQLMKDIGVDSIKISPCIVDNDGTKNNEYHKPFYDQAKAMSIKVKQELEDNNFEVNELYHWQEEASAKDYEWCPYSQILPVIGADLNIYPCQDKAYNLDNGLMGSIKDSSFKEFWFSDKNNFFKINPKVHCNNHCVADNKNKMILDYLNVEHLGFV
ncbi:radical SAM/SPASM domain-containing protein [Sulfurimonas sp.]|uniref:radical SAM/SPASM domain-containing protein n=1 Tax=Sulfurimonas sp. TaxID=2022749 RepID=UPI003569DDE8